MSKQLPRLTEPQRKLVEDYRLWAIKYVKRMPRPRHATLGDAIGGGLYGLCRAASYYQPDCEFRFVTYAKRHVRREAIRAMNKQAPIQTPVRHSWKSEDDADEAEASRRRISDVARDVRRLDDLNYRTGEPWSWNAVAPEEPNPVEIRDEVEACLRSAAKLDGPHVETLVARALGATLKQIGAAHGVTKERVRQRIRETAAHVRWERGL